MGKKPEIREDVWVPTQCARCYANCSVRVRRVNGVAVKVEGNPDSPMGALGGVCAKGLSGLQVLYDPNRLRVPLRRTNPEKGLHADPKWKEITWEEALSEIADRLKKVIQDDPRKLQIQWTTARAVYAGIIFPFKKIFGGEKAGQFGSAAGRYDGPYINPGGGGLYCGQGSHEAAGTIHASWSIAPDYRYCNYAIFFGSNKGTGSGHSSAFCMRRSADARARGMKSVVFDPICNFNSGKADEWIPIIPGTDLAVALAMCNIILNELGIYDRVFLKTRTNAAYLVGPDFRYVRDRQSGQPLAWDAGEGRAKVYDDPTIADYALEGEFTVNGITCRPALQVLREHLRQYTPEMASGVSTVPAETVRRVATEFAEAAQIGSTINIGGHQLPYRPVSAIIFRGGQGHENSYHTCFAVHLLNLIMGAADVPGGTVGWPARSHGFPGTGRFSLPLIKGKDGLMETKHFGPSGAGVPRDGPWPAHMPENKHHLTLTDIFPMAMHTLVPWATDRQELWRKNQCNYRTEMQINWGCNSIMSLGNQEVAEEAYKNMFMVVFELFSTELAEGFADILLPDTCYLEETNWVEGLGFDFNYPFGMEDWCFGIMQPVVKPQYSRRHFADVMWEVAERVGLKQHLCDTLNSLYRVDERYRIRPEEKLTNELLTDKMLKTYFGPENDLETVKKRGFVTWPKKVEEAYWRYFEECRVPIYFEHLVDMGEKMRDVTRQTGIEVDLGQYTPLLSWFPCTIHRVEDPEYDLFCHTYRDTLHTGSHTMEQPWLDEASRMNPYTYNITMNRDTAAAKGLQDGDTIELESTAGYKVRGTLKTMQGQHPRTAGIAACSGHWARGMPIARGKGTNFNTLVEFNLKHADPLVLTPENCVRVRARKVSEL